MATISGTIREVLNIILALSAAIERQPCSIPSTIEVIYFIFMYINGVGWDVSSIIGIAAPDHSVYLTIFLNLYQIVWTFDIYRLFVGTVKLLSPVVVIISGNVSKIHSITIDVVTVIVHAGGFKP